MTSADCPKCRSRMEEGFIFDSTHGGQTQVVSWVEGVPEKSFWGGVKVGKRRKLEISVLRCTRCGYLESYARG